MIRHIACAVAALFVLTSCTTRYQKRGTEDPLPATLTVPEFEKNARDEAMKRAAQLDLEARSIERFKTKNGVDFSVGVVEFTDEGFVNRAQYDQVLQHVRDEMNDSSSRGTLLIVFAHGWHHSCRTCDRDIACFRRIMDEMADAESFHQGRRVVGVYLGWRGASLLGKWNALTLWNRKQVAEHIGRTGAKEVLSDLHAEWLSRRRSTRPVRMITVGHSLGGAMVFSAVKGKLSGNADDIIRPGQAGTLRITRAEQSRVEAWPTGRKARRARFGDLVVLVNPAIEAAEYTAFDDDLQGAANEKIVDRGQEFPDDQLPILITIASKADTAVGRLFPAARWLSLANLPRNAEVLARRSERIGLGRYEPHITHHLEYGILEQDDTITPHPRDKVTDQKQPGCECTKEWGGHAEVNGGAPVAVPVRDDALPIRTLDDQKWPSNDGKSVMRFRLTEARRKRGWDVRSPYLVISADAGVINEHSDIFNPVFVTFLAEYLGGIESFRPKPPQTTTAVFCLSGE
jgi:hypothetical protein